MQHTMQHTFRSHTARILKTRYQPDKAHAAFRHYMVMWLAASSHSACMHAHNSCASVYAQVAAMQRAAPIMLQQHNTCQLYVPEQ
jgi:hypothetical protein